MKIISIFLCFSLLIVSASPALAQTGGTAIFKVNALVSGKKKPKQESSRIKFSENSFSVIKGKNGAIIKEFSYADIKAVDYSYSSKPFLSPRMQFAAQMIFSIYAIPLMFIKKKEHWLAIRTEDDFIVLKLKGKREQIMKEFENHKIAVQTSDGENRTN